MLFRGAPNPSTAVSIVADQGTPERRFSIGSDRRANVRPLQIKGPAKRRPRSAKRKERVLRALRRTTKVDEIGCRAWI